MGWSMVCMWRMGCGVVGGGQCGTGRWGGNPLSLPGSAPQAGAASRAGRCGRWSASAPEGGPARPWETPAGKPVEVVVRQVGQRAPGVFAVGHGVLDQFQQHGGSRQSVGRGAVRLVAGWQAAEGQAVWRSHFSRLHAGNRRRSSRAGFCWGAGGRVIAGVHGAAAGLWVQKGAVAIGPPCHREDFWPWRGSGQSPALFCSRFDDAGGSRSRPEGSTSPRRTVSAGGFPAAWCSSWSGSCRTGQRGSGSRLNTVNVNNLDGGAHGAGKWAHGAGGHGSALSLVEAQVGGEG